MDPALIQKMENLVDRHEELGIQLGDPSVAEDLTRFRDLGKAYAELTDTVTLFRQYKKVSQDIESSRELIEGDDSEMAELARQEIEALEPELEELDKNLRLCLLPSDPNDARNVILEIRAGTGGEEAGLFAADLYRMYSRYGEQMGWKQEILDSSETGIGGMKEVTLSLAGDKVYSWLKYESGVHRVQRVPTTEAQGRIHTSAVTVAVLPEAEEVDVRVDKEDLRIDRFCSSGPGGQSVNTTYSAIRITHIPTGLVVSCQDEKSQIKNKARALKILRSRLMKLEEDKVHAERSTTRKAMVGTGDRSEKIRTYNFPQSRITDHRINLTVHRLTEVLNGELGLILTPLAEAFEARRLEEEYSNVAS